MSEAVAFLRALAHYLSSARLYGPDHRVREEAADEVADAAAALLQRQHEVTFSFLPGRVVFRDRPLRELEDWPWAERLVEVGAQRIELTTGLTRSEVDGFLEELAGRMSREEPPDEEEGEKGRAWRHVRFGDLGVDSAATGGGEDGIVHLDEEAQAVGYIHEMAEEDGRIPVQETLAVVRSLSVAMKGAREIIVPFVRLKETDQYTAAHCLNVSVLAMALAESLDLGEIEVRAVGTAGLLHDVGKVDVPDEVLMKTGSLTDRDWAEMQRHPEHGCRILMESGSELALPAVVAYEHHVKWGGGGYPDLHYERSTLPQSRLVQVCDVYDALRTRRRYRKPMMAAEVLKIIRRNEDRTLDPQYIRPFVSLIERWDPATVLTEIRPEDEPQEEFEPA